LPKELRRIAACVQNHLLVFSAKFQAKSSVFVEYIEWSGNLYAYVTAKTNGGASQKFAFGAASFPDWWVIMKDGKCTGFDGTAQQYWPVQYPCNGSDNQAWSFVVPALPPVNVSGSVRDATNNTPIAPGGNLKVTFMIDSNVIQAAVDDSSATYQVTLPHAGVYKRTITRDGYANNVRDVTIQDSGALPFAYLSPTLVGWRIVLSWGDYPKDLDAHLILPDGREINWMEGHRQIGNAKLDVDSRNGNGVETITLSTHSDGGVFTYYVQNYSKDGDFRNSNAKISVYKDNDIVKTLQISTDPHSPTAFFWKVLTINGDTNDFTMQNVIAESL